jgi:hypothetical protein
VRPVVVQLDCGGDITRRVVVPTGQVPGFRVRSADVVLPASDRTCRVRAEDPGVPPQSSTGEVSLAVDGAALGAGEWRTITAAPGDERQVTVRLTFNGQALHEPAPPRAGGRRAGEESLSLAVTLGLAAVFALGLLGAIARSRRAA